MTLDDLFLEQQLHKMNKLDTAWARFQSEAHDMNRRGVRGRVAALFVRFGVWLDRGAGERVLTPKRVDEQKKTEAYHAISW